MNRADIALKQSHYDIIVLGAGMLGLATAFYLKKQLPNKSLLIIEEEGIPSEQGATHVSPAVLKTQHANPKIKAQLNWTLKTLKNLSQLTNVSRPNDVPFRQVGFMKFCKKETPQSQTTSSYLNTLEPPQQKAVNVMIDLNTYPFAQLDKYGGYGSAEAVALHYGYGAVKEGADLMLNARATPLSETKFKLSRLEYNRDMKRVIAKEDTVQASTIVFALGANTAEFIEDSLGQLLPLKKAYRQYPRIEADKHLPLKENKVHLPVLVANGFVMRPQGEGLLLCPPLLSADPKGYTPTEGNMMGVRVGLRREILEQLIDASDDLPLLSWDSLNLGKTVTNVRGSWDVLTQTGLPEYFAISQNHYALVGGQEGFSLGLARAYELAERIANYF